MKYKKGIYIARTTIILILIGYIASGCSQKSDGYISNPIYNGYLADPSIVKLDDTYYIYATYDPWGGDELAVIVSKDFINWEIKHLNWPTKQACTSATSGDSRVWAPSVIKALNGKYYMYVSVGSEVWVGVSEDPLGPWQNAKGDQTPLINRDIFPEFHMIDAECFIDDDGQAYLYWGSGLNWINGHCFAVKLNNDMVTFDGEIKDITPPNYFEAPFMLKHNNIYYLMYSEGKCTDYSYKVRYSTGKTPFGPWEEGATSPILSTSDDSTTYGPGHHTVFNEQGQDYILYHRIYQYKDSLLRQLCIDSLNFTAQGDIKKVNPNGIGSFIKKEDAR